MFPFPLTLLQFSLPTTNPFHFGRGRAHGKKSGTARLIPNFDLLGNNGTFLGGVSICRSGGHGSLVTWLGRVGVGNLRVRGAAVLRGPSWIHSRLVYCASGAVIIELNLSM